jgi:hypothetical protein
MGTDAMNGPALTIVQSKRATRRAWRTGLACLIACAAVMATLPARAADGDEEKSFDEKIIEGILKGAGLRDDSANIDYRERSPLVIPPETTLPPPDTTSVTSNPNWPVDPEIKRARSAKKSTSNNYLTGDPLLDDGRPLRPEEMMRGRKAGSGGVTASNQVTSDYSEKMTPNQLGARGGLFNNLFAPSEEVAPFTGEPARTSLIEPPRGYQTPSPAQPYGVGKSKASYGSGPVQDNYTTRVESHQ